MKKSKFTEAQILGVLKELDAGTPATTVARRIGVHADTTRAWRDKYADEKEGHEKRDSASSGPAVL